MTYNMFDFEVKVKYPHVTKRKGRKTKPKEKSRRDEVCRGDRGEGRSLFLLHCKCSSLWTVISYNRFLVELFRHLSNKKYFFFPLCFFQSLGLSVHITQKFQGMCQPLRDHIGRLFIPNQGTGILQDTLYLSCRMRREILHLVRNLLINALPCDQLFIFNFLQGGKKGACPVEDSEV